MGRRGVRGQQRAVGSGLDDHEQSQREFHTRADGSDVHADGQQHRHGADQRPGDGDGDGAHEPPATAISGTNWNCTQPAGPCRRSDVLAAGGSYPAINLTVNVAANAVANVTNTVTVTGGGETNTSNDQASDPTTIAVSGGGTPTSIWNSTATPAAVDASTSATTTGVKFRSDVAGSITGIRFYKGAANTGTYIGLLYSSTGTSLGQATYAGSPTASGWQQVNFSSGVAILANTTYIAAYFSASGFAYDGGYFTGSGVDNAPLHALQSGVDGPNGLELYGSSAQFPTTSYNNPNYWVDVVFSAAAVSPGPDLTVTSRHSGSFTQGQIGARYAITASNVGNGPTSGTVTVTDTLPTGLTATSIAGSNWTCTQPAGPCTRSDSLAAGASYPALTLTVNVATNAAASVTNTVNVSGGSETNTNNDQATEVTTILSAGGTGTATSIWSPSAIPGDVYTATAGTTAGLKFRTDVAGTITGIRFYKGAANTGSYAVLLYNSSGILLGQRRIRGARQLLGGSR